MRLYGIRNWIEQSYKQVKDELGWADFQVRSDLAIRRHQTLVSCAFSFCWQAWFADPPPRQTDAANAAGQPAGGERGPQTATPPAPPSWPATLRAVRGWLTPWIAFGAGGGPGHRRPRRPSCGPGGRGPCRAASTSTFHLDPTNYR